MSKTLFKPVVLILLAVGCGLGAWAASRASVSRSLEAMFIDTVLCPIRSRYPSWVSEETAAEIKREQDALRSQLQSQSTLLNAAAAASGLGCLLSLSFAVWCLRMRGLASPRDLSEKDAETPVVDRWPRWCAYSFVVQISTWFFYPAFICGCHFHVIAVPVGLIPVVWGGITLFGYRTLGERILGYINTALAVGWLYLAWDSNIQFAVS